MKKSVLIMTLFLSFFISGCSSTSNTATESDKPSASSSSSVATNAILDLRGGWKQSNTIDNDTIHIAVITDDTIEIHIRSQSANIDYLYWSGTYIPPTDPTDEYFWNSSNHKNYNDSSPLASLASAEENKTFTYKNGTISYEFSIPGVTQTVELQPSDTVDFHVEGPNSKDSSNALQIVESSFFMSEDPGKLKYVFAVKNPSQHKTFEFVGAKAVARDSNGSPLGSTETYTEMILPGETWYGYGYISGINEKPAKVDLEITEMPGEWSSTFAESTKPLVIESYERHDKFILGEVSNPNTIPVKSPVTAVFRDANGKLLVATSTNVDIPAGGKTSFEIPVYGADDEYFTDNFTVHAYVYFRSQG